MSSDNPYRAMDLVRKLDQRQASRHRALLARAPSTASLQGQEPPR